MDPQLLGEYFQNILEQPRAVRDTLAGTMPLEGLRDFAEKIRMHEMDTVILTGMGASFHALQPLWLELTGHGIRAQRIETSELLYHAPRLVNSRNLVVPVSQSGQSVEIVRLVEQLRASKIPCLGVTNTVNSPLAQASDVLVTTRAGAEFSVSSKTYVGTLAALSFIGAVLTGKDYAARVARLAQAAEAMERYLARWSDYVGALMNEFREIPYLVIAGRGASLAAAGLGALIIREAARLPCLDMSSAAFRHGPMEMISPQLFVLVFEGLPPTQELNARLVSDIRKEGGRAALVKQANAADVFSLPPVPPEALPLLETLVPEMISLALARLRGHIPGNFERNTKVTTIE